MCTLGWRRMQFFFCQRSKRREPKDVLMERIPKSKKLKKFWLNKLNSFLCSETSPRFPFANGSLPLPRQESRLRPQPWTSSQSFLSKCPRLTWPLWPRTFQYWNQSSSGQSGTAALPTLPSAPWEAPSEPLTLTLELVESSSSWWGARNHSGFLLLP